MRNDEKKTSYGSVVNEEAVHNDDSIDKSYESIKADDIINQTHCKCSYIIEPVLLIQSLAAQIITNIYTQFIYARILNRITNEDVTNMYVINNQSVIIHNTTTATLPITTITPSTSLTPYYTTKTASASNYTSCSTNGTSDFDVLRLKAQEQTANLLFISSLCLLPCILTTNILGVNCSKLGRKFLLVFSLVIMNLRYAGFLMLVIYPSLPDYVFYICSFMEGLAGGNGLYYFVLHCYITDLTTNKHRSYRLTLVNYMSSISSLFISFACGYVIKYFGFFYLFLASLVLNSIALVYTCVFVPESLQRLKNRSIFQRIQSCSISRIKNSFYVLTRKTHPVVPRKPRDETENIETDRLLGIENNFVEPEITTVNENKIKHRQRSVIVLVIVANLIYCGACTGIGSIFTLYLMNVPFCWDSVYISSYAVFSTVTQVVSVLFVSKLIQINDILICIASCFSNFVSLFVYASASKTLDIYIATSIGSILGLEFSYVRSIVSKLVTQYEISDALTFITCVDTTTLVLANIIFPLVYSHLVGFEIRIIFFAVIGIISISIFLHICAYLKYKNETPEMRTMNDNDELVENDATASIAVATMDNIEPLLVGGNTNQTDTMAQFYASLAVASHEST